MSWEQLTASSDPTRAAQNAPGWKAHLWAALPCHKQIFFQQNKSFPSQQRGMSPPKDSCCRRHLKLHLY